MCFGYTSWVFFKTVSMVVFVPMHTHKREFMVNITFKLECTGRHTDLQLFERKSLWSRFRQKDMKFLWESEGVQGAPFYPLLCFLQIIFFLFKLAKLSLCFTCLWRDLCRIADLELFYAITNKVLLNKIDLQISSRIHSPIFKW